MHTVRQDLRYALRALRRAPGFTAVAALTLALGIGATTSIFSVVSGVLLRPLPFPSADELVQIHTRIQGEAESRRSLSPPNFASLRDASGTFSALSAVLGSDHAVTGVGPARTVESAQVSASFHGVLGTPPALGRGFLPDENEPSGAAVAIISDGLWRELFERAADVLGRRIMLDGVAHTIVGVMPAGFAFPEGTSLWVPLKYDGAFSASTAEGRQSNTWIPVIGRLRRGLDIDGARGEMESFSRDIEREFPATNAGVTFIPVPLHTEVVGGVQRPLFLLLGAVALLLVIACTNIAGLLLARAASRRGEMAIRGALGAGRARLVQQVLTEALVLAVSGGILGVLLAWWATPVLTAAAPPTALPRLGEVGIDLPVLAFAVGLIVVATLISGVLPALRATDGTLPSALRGAGRSGLGTVSGQRARGALVVGQLALAVILLACSGLLLRSFAKLMAVDPGFDTRNAVAFDVEAARATYSTDSAVAGFFDELIAEVRTVAGVQRVGGVSRLPLASGAFTSRFRVDNDGMAVGASEGSIGVRTVTPDYFRAIGIPAQRGRSIAAQDVPGSEPVAVINEAAASRYFPGSDPIGRRLVDFSYDPVEAAADAFTIVGVVGNVRHSGLDQPAAPEVFFAHAQIPLRSLTIVSRLDGPLSAVVPSLREAITAVDPELPVPTFQSLADVVSASVARSRFVTTLVGLFAGLALLLAALGLFGLLSFTVAQRTREFGIRIALGAQTAEVISLATRRAIQLIVAGLALGLAGALLGSRALEGMLFGIGRGDPITLLGVSAVLALTGVAAAWIPARRAAAVDPVIALRAE
jgi:predicted permease